jgi:hypothetical protein
MTTDHYDEKYTKPELRRQLKAEIKDSDQGGKPGQWSARKSQHLVQEYEKQGGDYKNNEKDEAAQSLEHWAEQDWQTQEGDARARQSGKTKRYLPKTVWDQLSDAEKKEAEQTKQQASQKGQQHVEWPPAVKRAMQAEGYAADDPEPTQQDLYQEAQELQIKGRSKMAKDELQDAIADAKANALENQTRDQLYEKAQALNIRDRSKMNKDNLIEAIRAAEAN